MNGIARGLRRLAPAAAMLAALSLNNCADDVGVAVDDLTEVSIQAGDSLTLNASLADDTPVVMTVNCGIPSSVDAMGSLISVTSEDVALDVGAGDEARAAYWQWAGVLPAGNTAVTIHNEGYEAASCQVDLRAQVPAPEGEQACQDYTIHRSQIRDAVHLPLGNTESGEWETLPASGNHWGAWAAWNTVYPKPVLRGFYLHNLEHGGAVLSYGCESAEESQACADAEAALIELAGRFGQNRIIVTPDPTQPTMFAVRTWRFAYASDCLNGEAALDFLTDTFRRGREDIDADPPLPFDPTSHENVPCEVLMAAPDSC